VNCPMAQLAYLFPVFPVFHQTFVLWEVLGLRRNGVHPKLYSWRRPSDRQQPEGQQLVREVNYLPRTVSRAVLGANWRAARADFGRYIRLYVAVLEAWHTGKTPPEHKVRSQHHSPTPYDRVRGWFNTQPVLYLFKSLWLVPTAVYLAERLQSDGITHLHVHWASYPATMAYVVHLISGMSFSVSAHAYDIYMVQRMLPAKLRSARFVVTCAKTNAHFLERLAGADLSEKIIVNYHGVDVSRFAPAPAAKPADRFTILSCGQLEQYKGMHVLIDACAKLIRSGINLECWIIGEGPQRRQLQRQIERLGVVERIHLAGARAQTEVADFLRKADLFVLASELNGKFGRRDVIANVIVEAMAAGLPVVASCIPGVEELVEEGVTGLLVQPNHVNQLAQAIATLALSTNERRRLGQAARERILRDFDSSKNVRSLAQLLSHLSDDEIKRLAGTAPQWNNPCLCGHPVQSA
jgi:colanic acid/amylovoran biosynthesis glycosyltransferase